MALAQLGPRPLPGVRTAAFKGSSPEEMLGVWLPATSVVPLDPTEVAATARGVPVSAGARRTVGALVEQSLVLTRRSSAGASEPRSVEAVAVELIPSTACPPLTRQFPAVAKQPRPVVAFSVASAQLGPRPLPGVRTAALGGRISRRCWVCSCPQPQWSPWIPLRLWRPPGAFPRALARVARWGPLWNSRRR